MSWLNPSRLPRQSTSHDNVWGGQVIAVGQGNRQAQAAVDPCYTVAHGDVMRTCSDGAMMQVLTQPPYQPSPRPDGMPTGRREHPAAVVDPHTATPSAAPVRPSHTPCRPRFGSNIHSSSENAGQFPARTPSAHGRNGPASVRCGQENIPKSATGKNKFRSI